MRWSARRSCALAKLRSKQNKERRAPKIPARVERKDSRRGWKNVRLLAVVVVVVVVVWVGFCRASEIAAVYLTQPTEIPFHLASRIYRAAFSPYPTTGISPSRTPLPLSLRSSRSEAILRCFFSLTLIYFIRAIFTVYATYPRPPIGPQFTEISCGAPGRAAYVHLRIPSYTPTF